MILNFYKQKPSAHVMNIIGSWSVGWCGPAELCDDDELTMIVMWWWLMIDTCGRPIRNTRDVVSVLNVSVSRRSRDVFWNVSSRLGLVGSTSRSCLGLESLKKWNVSVSSRSCDLTSCGHPCTIPMFIMWHSYVCDTCSQSMWWWFRQERSQSLPLPALVKWRKNQKL